MASKQIGSDGLYDNTWHDPLSHHITRGHHFNPNTKITKCKTPNKCLTARLGPSLIKCDVDRCRQTRRVFYQTRRVYWNRACSPQGRTNADSLCPFIPIEAKHSEKLISSLLVSSMISNIITSNIITSNIITPPLASAEAQYRLTTLR